MISTLNKNIKIAFCNAQSVNNEKHKLEHFLNKHNIDIILLQETFSKPQVKFNTPNYLTYRQDRLQGKGGGTSILINKKIKHQEIQPCATTNIENTAIEIKTNTGNIQLYSIYISPLLKKTTEDLKFTKETNKTIIAAGNLNARHLNWHSKRTCKRGEFIEHFAKTNSIIVHRPTNSTHFYNNESDVIDFALINNISVNNEIKVKNELS